MRGSQQPLVINGAYGEGGGALLRTALAMSALTLQPLRIHGIRGALRKRGLNSEDLIFLSALATSCNAEVRGDELDSAELTFVPKRTPRSLDQRFDIGAYEKGAVSGSVPVIMQSLLPVLCRSGVYSHISILGETHGSNTLGFDPFERVSLAVHRRQGVCGFVSQLWAGFGSTAKGELALEVEPSVPLALNWPDRGELRQCGAVVSYAEISPDIAERGAKKLKQLFHDRKLDVDVELIQVKSRGAGVAVTVWAEFERGFGSGSANGSRGLKMETVCDTAFRVFDEWFSSTATVDPFLADQMLVIAALAEGKTVYTTPRITRRLISMTWVIKQFMPVHITIKGEENYPGTITIER